MPPTSPHLVRAAAALAATLVSACGDSELTAVNGDPTSIPLDLVTQVVLPDPTTLASIETASISGNTLRLHVTCGGGCGTHEFGLVSQRNLLESAPPQVILVLRHDGHGDACRAGLQANLEADLRPLQALAGEGRTLGVRLYAPEAATSVGTPLEYSF